MRSIIILKASCLGIRVPHAPEPTKNPQLLPGPRMHLAYFERILQQSRLVARIGHWHSLGLSMAHLGIETRTAQTTYTGQHPCARSTVRGLLLLSSGTRRKTSGGKTPSKRQLLTLMAQNLARYVG